MLGQRICNGAFNRLSPRKFLALLPLVSSGLFPGATPRYLVTASPGLSCTSTDPNDMSESDSSPQSQASRWEGMWSKDGGLKQGQAFDASGPLPFIEKLFEHKLVPEGQGLVPGCGRGYAVQAFARDGRHVIGLDISKTATAAAKAHLQKQEVDPETYAIQTGSFFDLNTNDFNFAYDYTFLCALPPSLRQSWAETYARILKPNGALITVVFPLKFQGDRPAGAGPPFELTEQLVADLLEPQGFKAVFKKALGPGEAHQGRDGSEGAMASTSIIVWKQSAAAAASSDKGTGESAQQQQDGGGGGGGASNAAQEGDD